MEDHRTFALPPALWDDFVERSWERAPTVIKQPFGAPIASPDEVFGAMAAAAQAHLRGNLERRAPRVRVVRFFEEGAEIITDLPERLPAPADGGAAGYFARVERQLGGRPFELVVSEVQEHALPVWPRLRQFVHGLVRRVGLPAARANVYSFLRTQQRTSLGMHRDDLSVFLFVIAGKKRILTWPEAEMRGREGLLPTARYDAFRREATVLEGEPGDILYWPSSHWHAGESDGGPSISLNLGLQLHPVSLDVLRQLSQLAERRVAGTVGTTWPLDPEDLQRSALAVPEAVRQSLIAAREIAAHESLESYGELQWLRRVSALGFVRVPPPGPHRALSDADTVRVCPGEPILRAPFGEGRVACAVSGNASILDATPALTALLERLDRGGSLEVGPLLLACTGDGGGPRREALRHALEKLVTLRAVAVER